MKAAADMEVEFRQIYSSGCRSHHPNDTPQQANPNYKMEERGPSPSYHQSGMWREKGIGLSLVEIGGNCRRLSPGRRRSENGSRKAISR
jgi:hypothetical protein